MHRHYTKTVILLTLSLFTLVWRVIFASDEWTTLALGINNTITHMIYTPANSSGFFTSGNVYASITWSSSITGILDYTLTENWTYTFSYLRGTWPYTSWLSYWPTNLWNHLTLVEDITWIDKIFPIFNLVIWPDTHSIIIYFSDNTPGVSATINGVSYINGTTISIPWTYTFFLTDVAGNSISFSFTVIAPLPNPGGGGWWWGWGGGWIWAVITTPPCTINDLVCNNSLYSLKQGKVCDIWSRAFASCTISTWEVHSAPDTATGNIRSPYGIEFTNAYLWAHAYSITTMSTIQQADMTWVVFRKHLAKMISTFAMQFAWKTPNATKKCIFSDMHNESKEMQYFAIVSCQLGLMWLQEDGVTPKTLFEPNLIVNRAQFGTVLSRLLFGDTYNIHPWERTLLTTIKNDIKSVISSIGQTFWSSISLHQELLRYSKHLQALKDHDIMRQINTPMMFELRWYVMLMLMRADILWVVTQWSSW